MSTVQERNCDLCEAQHLTSKADIWCPNCEEALCSKCKAQHGVAKITKAHKTIPIENFEKLPTFVQEIIQECQEHQEKFEFFCSLHDTACCVKCLKTTHHKCHETLTSLGDVVEGFKSSKVFIDTESSIKDVVSNLKTVCGFQQNNIQLLTEKKESCEKKITEKRQKINQQLDTLEQRLREELSALYDQNKTSIENKVSEIKSSEERITKTQNILGDIKLNATEFQAYFCIQKINEDIRKEDNFRQTFVNPENKIVIKGLELECTTEQGLEVEMIFGKIKIEEIPIDIQFKKTAKIEAQIQSTTNGDAKINPVVLQKKSSFTLVRKGPERTFVGITTTTDGNFVFSDAKNNCLIVSDKGGKNIKTVNICHSPSDIASLDNMIVIAFALVNQVHIFQLEAEKTETSISCQASPTSVSVMNNNKIVVGMTNHGFQIFDCSRKAMSKLIRVKLANSSYFIVLSEKIFYTEHLYNKVLCIDQQGKPVFEHCYKDLKTAIGITVDDIGNIYVCGFNSNNVCILSKDGSQCKEIICQSEGIQNPRCLHYVQEGKLLVVVNQRGDVCIYEVVSNF